MSSYQRNGIRKLGYPQWSNDISERDEETITLHRAVDAVLNSYSISKHRQQVDAVESLEEFWQTKLSKMPSPELIIYELEPGDRAPYVSYVTLPGGSCFGSFEYCRTKADAKCSAAKIALMNSVLNEHPSRKCITDDFIERAVNQANTIEQEFINKRQSDKEHSSKVVHAYRFMLRAMKGKSQLEFQELMTMFRLLDWNGTLRVLRDKRLSRQHVLSHYKSRTIDEDIRGQMALDWVSREQTTTDIVANSYEQACREIREFSLKGRELRFVKEKKEILALAMQQLGQA